MQALVNLAARCFNSYGPVLHVGGASVAELANRYGTPLFLYDRNALDRRLDALEAAFPHFEIFYSVKANPTLAFLRHFVLRGCGLEIASAGEFIQALAAGCPPERIFFAGPGKTDGELDLTVSGNVGEIHVESPREAERIASFCTLTGYRARVGIRVNPTGDAQGGAMRMGGKAAPFGVDEEELDSLVAYLVSKPCFDFRGIHMFVGTQVLDYSVLMTQYRKAIGLARHVASRIGRPLHTVDFGGGLGIPYFTGESELDLTRLELEMATMMDEVRRDPAFRGTRFVIEPGRFLVGEAGVYVARITDIKVSRGKKFLILDGGMNHHLAASGNLGQTIKRNYPVALVEKLHDEPEETVDVVGPLCTPLDTIGRGLHLPKANIGDLVGVFQSGAYARTASPLGFLSHNTPAEVWIDRGADFLIRKPGSTEDLFRDVSVPASMWSATVTAGN
ncbi:MAG TPA: type III PLP-dependent enzyme [Terriglobia bacterium]|nr:type III PLP-dependent enzyme [Terriglobia bacterium]